ncbi:hypothetical protein KVT40_001966 [Elsinoe batatas]|uniref:Uncharacterized protein n=1 Tax=Elsinoe batatas TaxID=2601811 RepID=A0A8K0PJA9_9PEZI|nr:hypothetical protein KVT40_001966 [Elsinoe batatas]
MRRKECWEKLLSISQFQAYVRLTLHSSGIMAINRGPIIQVHTDESLSRAQAGKESDGYTRMAVVVDVRGVWNEQRSRIKVIGLMVAYCQRVQDLDRDRAQISDHVLVHSNDVQLITQDNIAGKVYLERENSADENGQIGYRTNLDTSSQNVLVNKGTPDALSPVEISINLKRAHDFIIDMHGNSMAEPLVPDEILVRYGPQHEIPSSEFNTRTKNLAITNLPKYYICGYSRRSPAKYFEDAAAFWPLKANLVLSDQS